MVTLNARHTQENRIKPLTIRTPLQPYESITSWLVRAALNQGCDPKTFVQFYWDDYRLWHYDVDKGLSGIKENIHEDMAILAGTDKESFEKNTLNYLSAFTQESVSHTNVNQNWVLPLSKRSSKSRLGYSYCRKCFERSDTAYLDVRWRFSFYVYCDKHINSMLENCTNCGMPYQPNLLKAEQRYLNECHHCGSKLDDISLTRIITYPETFQFQRNALKILNGGIVEVLDQQLIGHEWFDLMSFYLIIIRKATKAIETNHLFFRLVKALGLNITTQEGKPVFEKSQLDLAFNYLPFEERTQFMYFANLLAKIPVETWLKACEEVGATKNSFHWSARTKLPKAFKVVYDQLPSSQRKPREQKPTTQAIRSPESVNKLWQQLKRKSKMKDLYDQQKTR